MSLTAEEREAILLYNDADQAWSVHCDSRTLRTKITRWLARLGIQPQPLGEGFEAEGIPRHAVSLRVPRTLSPSERKRRGDQGRRALQKARRRPKSNIVSQRKRVPAPPGVSR